MIIKNLPKILFLFVLSIALSGSAYAAKKIVISTSESDAKIYIDGVMSGEGQVTIKVRRNTCVTVRAEKVGFLENKVTFCNKKSAAKLPKSYYIEMQRDDSYDASVHTDIANRNIEINTKQDYDEAWKLINRIVVSYFDAIEITDKETGYIRTSWEAQSFKQNTIRSRIIVTLASENPLTFKIKLVSELADEPMTSVKKSELFNQWDRVLRRYANIISEVQSRVQ